VSFHHGANPATTNIFSKAYQSASAAMEKTYGKKPIPVKAGGSIPVVGFFQEELGVDVILLGFGLDSDAIHSPNESYRLENFYAGIQTIPWFYHYFAK
jgi:acetylornithine deacetylase/succinyl-diaminopimelate desuccinylase-like protein